MPKQRRRPVQGAASDAHVTIENRNDGYIADPATGPQALALQAFWSNACGLVDCTIIRRSDRAWWLTALAARDPRAIETTGMIGDWILCVAEGQPISIGCQATFSQRSLPIDLALLTPALGGPLGDEFGHRVIEPVRCTHSDALDAGNGQ